MFIRGGKIQCQQDYSRTEDLPNELHVLRVDDLIPLPSVMLSIDLEDSELIEIANKAIATEGKFIFIFPNTSDYGEKVGVVASIVNSYKNNGSTLKLMLQGVSRASILSESVESATVSIKVLEDYDLPNEKLVEAKDKVNEIISNIEYLVEKDYIPEEVLLISNEVDNLSQFTDIVIAQFSSADDVMIKALTSRDILERMNIAWSIVSDLKNNLVVAEDIQSKIQSNITKNQREQYLRDQLEQIQIELGHDDIFTKDIKNLRLKLKDFKLPDEAKKEVERQLSRLENISPETSEYSMLRTYIEWIFEIPWSVRTRDKLDPKKARKILDRDHFGLTKAKDRVIEYLCVRRLNRSIRGPILCFVGPPGVGKTSFGLSIAKALGRKSFRMSLGGLRDEAEIRGHRRTYLGAMPGRIIQALCSVGSINPVIILDEIDKIGNDFRGDPASALLEVLDPQQNKEFRDHYLNLNINLSEILFIATANTAETIPEALVDRLEVIHNSGYAIDDKLNIASKFIIPRQLQENGLNSHPIEFTDNSVKYLVERYTEEAGVRSLEREVASLCRKIARGFVENGEIPAKIEKETVGKLLGPTKYDLEQRGRENVVGLAYGLAWTVNGGEILQVEASTADGAGILTLTGQLGAVMQESAQAAVFYARAHAKELKISSKFHQDLDIHIHVPAGATPKDGPSAGITIATALLSVLLNRPVSSLVAMTGEITLSGNVIQVGGLKEKILAALRHGFKKIIIPKANVKDLTDISPEKLASIEVIPVTNIAEVFEIALVSKKGRSKKR